jgi:hypothetical protein
LKDYTKSDVIKVSDTNGDSKLEVNTPKLPVEEERPLVLKERKNDLSIQSLSISIL